MLGQVNGQTQMAVLNTQLQSDGAYSKAEIIELVQKLFSYGKHIGLDRDTYNQGSLLVRKGAKRNSIWIKVELVDVEKLQKNRLQTKLVFYSEKGNSETSWFTSYFHRGDWVKQLAEVVSLFEQECLKD